jgi:hypothetical protein
VGQIYCMVVTCLGVCIYIYIYIMKAKRMVLQCINGVSSNSVKGRTKIWQPLKSNSSTVWFNFQTYIYIYVWLKQIYCMVVTCLGVCIYIYIYIMIRVCFFFLNLILKYEKVIKLPTTKNVFLFYNTLDHRALDVRLSEWCCSVSMVWVQIPSREEQKFDSL